MTIGPLTLSPPQKLQFFLPGTTVPAVGAQVFTYAAGTMTAQNTYSNINQTPNANPIILDANGECVCYLDSTLEYDFWFSPSTDTNPPTNPYWTVYSVGYGSMLNGLAPLNSPTFTGTPKAPTPTAGDNSTNIATTQFVGNAVTTEAGNLLASPAFTGVPTAPTATAGTDTTQIATTAFVVTDVTAAIAAAIGSGSTTSQNNVTINGFKFQTGTGSVTATAGQAVASISVSFPTPYTNAPVVVISTTNVGFVSSGAASQAASGVTSVTTSGFTANFEAIGPVGVTFVSPINFNWASFGL